MNTTTSEQTLTAAELQDGKHRRHVEARRRPRGKIERISKAQTHRGLIKQWSKSGVNRSQSRLIADNRG